MTVKVPIRESRKLSLLKVPITGENGIEYTYLRRVKNITLVPVSDSKLFIGLGAQSIRKMIENGECKSYDNLANELHPRTSKRGKPRFINLDEFIN